MCLAKLVLVLACVAGFTEAVIFFSRCPNVSTKPNFIPAAYLGKWYQQYSYPNIWQLGGKCTTAEYTASGSSNVGVRNTQVNFQGTSSSIEGTAYPDSTTNNQGKYKVNFPSVRNSWGKYWVLDTDYTKYAIVWSCKYYFGFNDQNMWILTRDKNAGVNDLQNYRAKVSKMGLATWPLRSTSQSC